MATLQSGQTISIQLAEGESYTVTPSGTAQVSTRGVSGSELSAPRTLTSAQTFGPYTEAGAISIACLSGTVDYTQAGGAVYQDPTTGALVGADGWSLVGGKGPSGNRLVVLGDSITAFGGLSAPPTAVTAVGNVVTINLTNHGESVGNLGVLHLATQVEYNGVWLVDSVIDANNFTVRVTNAPTVSPATGPIVWISSRSTTSLSYWTWADFLLGGPFDIQANAGVGGNTTAEILARLDADVLSLRPNIVIALVGTNDVRYVQTPASMELAWENLQQIYARVLSSGALLVVCSVLPVSSADSGAATVLPLQRALNARIAAYASATANVVFADTYAAIVDSASADGRALTSMLLDSVHPNAVGAYLVGKALAAALAPIRAAMAQIWHKIDLI